MLEDEQIIDLYWNRNELAIATTDQKYGGYCHSIALHILHNGSDADECINDVFLKAWNTIPPTRPTMFRVWLGKITRNLSIDRYKALSAKKRGGGEMDLLFSELEGCLSSQNTTERAYDDQEIAVIISQFLIQSSKDSRIIFLRRYFYGESLLEIAKRFDMSESKVKSSLFRTRNALKIHLEKEGVLI